MDFLRRQAGALIFQHGTNHVRFICTAHQEDDTSCIIEHRVSKRDPISFEFFHQFATTRRFVSLSAAVFGNKDAVWPSGPRPSKIKSKRGNSPGLKRKNDLRASS